MVCNGLTSHVSIQTICMQQPGSLVCGSDHVRSGLHQPGHVHLPLDLHSLAAIDGRSKHRGRHARHLEDVDQLARPVQQQLLIGTLLHLLLDNAFMKSGEERGRRENNCTRKRDGREGGEGKEVGEKTHNA